MLCDNGWHFWVPYTLGNTPWLRPRRVLPVSACLWACNCTSFSSCKVTTIRRYTICGKTADRMPFGIIGRTGPGMRQVVGFGDRFTGRGIFGDEFGAHHCNQWGLYGVCVLQRRDAALFPNYFGQTCYYYLRCLQVGRQTNITSTASTSNSKCQNASSIHNVRHSWQSSSSL